jgi:hypothetical protein
MKIQQDIRLTTKEQQLEWALLVLALLFVLLVIAGIITQAREVRWDNVLIPMFFFCGGLFFVLFGSNGLVKGQLVGKWTPNILRTWMTAITRVFIKRSRDKKGDTWKITFGIASLILGIVCATMAFHDLFSHF